MSSSFLFILICIELRSSRCLSSRSRLSFSNFQRSPSWLVFLLFALSSSFCWSSSSCSFFLSRSKTAWLAYSLYILISVENLSASLAAWTARSFSWYNWVLISPFSPSRLSLSSWSISRMLWFSASLFTMAVSSLEILSTNSSFLSRASFRSFWSFAWFSKAWSTLRYCSSFSWWNRCSRFSRSKTALLAPRLYSSLSSCSCSNWFYRFLHLSRASFNFGFTCTRSFSSSVCLSRLSFSNWRYFSASIFSMESKLMTLAFQGFLGVSSGS